MRFLHVADLHIGKRLNGMSLVDDQRYILQQVISLANERNVDALLIAGDIYDKAAPSAEAVTILDWFLTELSGAGIRVLGVPGNHDSAERIAYAQGLLAAQGVCFPPVFDGSVACVELQDEYGPVDVWLLPFLKPGDVRRFFPDCEIGDNYAAALAAVMQACGVDRTKRNVVVSHQLVTAGGVVPDRADDEIKLGGIDNVDVSVYDDFDYVALGHVHRAQRVGRDTVRYAGSPLKYSFSEARYDKKATLVELGPKKSDDAVGACVSFELVPLEPLHDMREVRMSLDELLRLGRSHRGEDALRDDDGTSEIIQSMAEAGEGGKCADEDFATCDFAEDYLHITLTDEHPRMDAMAKVRELYPNAMALDYDNVAVLTTRNSANETIDPDSMGLLELFSAFYEEQVGKPMDDEQEKLVAEIAREVGEGEARGEMADGCREGGDRVAPHAGPSEGGADKEEDAQ